MDPPWTGLSVARMVRFSWCFALCRYTMKPVTNVDLSNVRDNGSGMDTHKESGMDTHSDRKGECALQGSVDDSVD